MSMPSPFLDEIEGPSALAGDLESPFADTLEPSPGALHFQQPDVDEEADPEDDELAGEATPIDDQMESWLSFPWWTPPQPAATGLSSARLEWPGASAEQLAFMRRVYDAHVARAVARGDKFTPSLPTAQLDTIYDGHEARKDAAAQAKRLLAAANADLKAAGLADRVRIGITSAYRSADRQFDIWQGKGGGGKRGFPHYYRVTEGIRRRTGDEHGDEAARRLAEYMGKYIAAPGYSNHQDGLAIDFGTGEVGKPLGKIGGRAWFHGWLVKNARRFGFHPYEAEAWHWVYRPGSEREEELVDPWAVATPAAAIPSGVLEVNEVTMLRAHRGRPPDLVLRWNAMPSADVVDVVVHLHGYTRPNMHLRRDIEPWAGIDLQPVEGAAGPSRMRPTVTLLPHGHDTGVKRGKINRYTFPALTTEGAVDRLVAFALEQFGRRVGAAQTPRMGRLILTAHSGGGAALMRILRSKDPHEVHVHDGLYQDASPLASWALKRLRRDRSLVESGGAPEGGMRVFYRPGTAKYSRALLAAVRRELSAAPAEVQRRYRVEASTLGHWQIPRQYGHRILADVGADVPNTKATTQGEIAFEVPDDAFESEGPLDFDTELDEAEEAEGWDTETTELDEEELFTDIGEAPLPDEEIALEAEVEGETPTGGVLTYPSGETLSILTGLPEGEREDYWDPTGSGNPLLDTGPAHKTKRLSMSFTVRELTTSGGVSADVARIDPAFVAMLQRLRDHIGRPITITSGYRSWKRNARIYADRKKKPTLSQHCGGRAADIKVSGMNGVEIARAALSALGPNIGIGLGYTFAHVDNRGHAQVWDYGGAPEGWIVEIRRLQREAGGRSGRAPSPSAAASELVQFAQRVLNAVQGEKLDDDGKLGPLTRAALERFRSQNGLGSGPALDSTTQVALVQRALEEIARQSIFGEIGVLDGTTTEAISAFKRQRGIGQDASLDAGLRRALTQALATAAAPG